ncbi:glycosyl transferase, partial [Streptomyces sp. DSM 41529]|nr:glycosyl transferase [Streptomyces sp. DSM 41529]
TPEYLPWLRWAVLVGGLVGAVGLLVVGRVGGRALALAVVGLSFAATLAGPAAYTVSTLNSGHQGSIVTAGPSGGGGMGGPGGGGRGGPGGGPGGAPGGGPDGGGGQRGGTQPPGGMPAAPGGAAPGGAVQGGAVPGGAGAGMRGEGGGGMGGLLN